MTEQPSEEISMESYPAQQPGFELKKTACCFFLQEEESERLVKLNDSSALIWQVSTGEWTVADIIDVLKDSYPNAADSMHSDVIQALDLLVDENVIKILEQPA